MGFFGVARKWVSSVVFRFLLHHSRLLGILFVFVLRGEGNKFTAYHSPEREVQAQDSPVSEDEWREKLGPKSNGGCSDTFLFRGSTIVSTRAAYHGLFYYLHKFCPSSEKLSEWTGTANGNSAHLGWLEDRVSEAKAVKAAWEAFQDAGGEASSEAQVGEAQAGSLGHSGDSIPPTGEEGDTTKSKPRPPFPYEVFLADGSIPCFAEGEWGDACDPGGCRFEQALLVHSLDIPVDDCLHPPGGPHAGKPYYTRTPLDVLQSLGGLKELNDYTVWNQMSLEYMHAPYHEMINEVYDFRFPDRSWHTVGYQSFLPPFASLGESQPLAEISFQNLFGMSEAEAVSKYSWLKVLIVSL